VKDVQVVCDEVLPLPPHPTRRTARKIESIAKNNFMYRKVFISWLLDFSFIRKNCSTSDNLAATKGIYF
jgi:hypothetical protein